MYHRRYIHCWSSTTSRSVFGSILQSLFWTVGVENLLTYTIDGLIHLGRDKRSCSHQKRIQNSSLRIPRQRKDKTEKVLGRENNFHSFRATFKTEYRDHEERKESKKITRQRIFRRSGPSDRIGVERARRSRPRPHVTYELWHLGIMRSRSRSWSGATIGSNVDRNETAGV